MFRRTWPVVAVQGAAGFVSSDAAPAGGGHKRPMSAVLGQLAAQHSTSVAVLRASIGERGGRTLLESYVGREVPFPWQGWDCVGDGGWEMVGELLAMGVLRCLVVCVAAVRVQLKL